MLILFFAIFIVSYLIYQLNKEIVNVFYNEPAKTLKFFGLIVMLLVFWMLLVALSVIAFSYYLS